MKVFVIIPAAGLGTRMGVAHVGQTPLRSKQFVELQGVPILIHTLRKFAAAPQVDSIWIAMRKAEMESFAPPWKQQRWANLFTWSRAENIGRSPSAMCSTRCPRARTTLC